MSKQKNLYVANDLVRLIVGEAAAEVRVAPGEGFIPGRRNQHLVLLSSQNALISAHYLTHWLLQLCKTQITHTELVKMLSTVWPEPLTKFYKNDS